MKEKTKHNLLVTIGCLLASASLGAALVIPVFTDKPRSFGEETLLEGNINKINPVGDTDWWIYPELQPYQIFNAPQINWSKFWSVFRNHVAYSLEGKHPVTGEWIQNNAYLTIDRTFLNDSTCKLNFIFDAPVTTDYRLTLAVDFKVLEYVNNTGNHSYTLTYEKDNATFNVVFNWSDMLQYSNLTFNHGIKEYQGKDIFWFRVRKNNIPQGTHVELDPTYTVYSGSNVYCSYASGRKLVRNSTGGLWCSFYENADIHIANSSDLGVTWTDTEVYGTTGSYQPCIAIDSNDVVHMVFYSYKNDANDYQLEYSNSSDWTTIVQIRNEDKHHNYPSIAIDSKDNIHIVYEKGEEGTSNDDQVAYINSTDGGATWGTEKILTDEANDGDDAWYPCIAINSTNSLHVVFMGEDHYSGFNDILHMQSDDSGATWSDWEADPVYQDGAKNQDSPNIVIDDNDKLHVAWHGLKQFNQVAYSHNATDSNSWSTAEWVTVDVDIGGVAVRNEYASLSVNDNDYIQMVWANQSEGVAHSYNDTSNWQIATAVLTNTGTTPNNYPNPNMICAQHPTVSGCKPNRPKTGYAFIAVSNNTKISYVASSDLTWDTTDEPWSNTNPINSNPIPSNGTTDVSISLSQLNITVNDINGNQSMNITFRTNASGTWKDADTNTSVSNGTYYCLNTTWITAYSTKYWWSVNTSDNHSTQGWDNDTYYFTTETQSRAWQQTFDWGISFSNSTSYKAVTSMTWDISFSNTTNYLQASTWNVSFSNTTTNIQTYSWNVSFSNTSSHDILEPSFETVNNWTYYENDSDCSGGQSSSGVTDGAKSYELIVQTTTGTGYCKVYQTHINLTNYSYIYTDFYFNSETVTDVPAYASIRVNGDILWEQRIEQAETAVHQNISADVSSYNDYCTLEYRLNMTDIGHWDESIGIYIDNIRTIIWHEISNWNISFSNTSSWYQQQSWNVSFSNSTVNWQQPYAWNISFSNTSVHLQIFSWNVSFGNTTDIQQTFSWNVSFSNSSVSDKQAFNWNVSFSNTSNWYQKYSWNVSFSNTSGRVWQQTSSWNISFSNTSNHLQTFSWNVSFSNTSDQYQTFSWNVSFSNSTTISQDFSWNVSFSNTSNHYQKFAWNVSFSNSTRLLEQVFTWNVSFSNTSNWYQHYSWNVSFSNSSVPLLIANFDYVVEGVNIICTSTSTGPPTGYRWTITVDDIEYGDTGWVDDTTASQHTFSKPGGGDYFLVTLCIRDATDTDCITKNIGTVDDDRDTYPSSDYNSCRDCEDAGYYWYDDKCHENPEPLPWNEEEELPEAGKHSEGKIEIFGWNVDIGFIIFVAIVGIFFFIIFRKKKKKE